MSRRDDHLDEPLGEILRSAYDAEAAAPLPDGCESRILAGAMARLADPAGGGDPGADATAGGETAAGADAAAGATATQTSVAASLWTAKGAVLAITSAVVGAAIGIGVDRQLGDEPRPEPPARVAPEVVPDTRVAPDAAAAVDATRALAEGAAVAPTPKRSRGSADREPAVPPSGEGLLIDRARTALRRGLVEDALIALMRHERRYPDGQLAEERDVLIIEAYVAAGDPRLAEKRIERYRRDHPAGFLRARVDRAEAALAP